MGLDEKVKGLREKDAHRHRPQYGGSQRAWWGM